MTPTRDPDAVTTARTRPSTVRASTANAAGLGSYGNTSDPASRTPRPPLTRRFATPGQAQPDGHRSRLRSAEKSTLRTTRALAANAGRALTARLAPVSAPAAI